MTERAQVRSVEAIDAFRSQLIVYLAKVRPLLEEVGSDLRRMQVWLETDARAQTEREIRRRARILEEAQQALLSARISSFREATVVEQTAVHTARRALAEVEERLHRIRTWAREFGPRTDPLARQVGVLDTVLSQEAARGVAWLAEILRALEAYAELRPSASGAAAAPATEPGAAAPVPAPSAPAPGTPDSASSASGTPDGEAAR